MPACNAGTVDSHWMRFLGDWRVGSSSRPGVPRSHREERQAGSRHQAPAPPRTFSSSLSSSREGDAEATLVSSPGPTGSSAARNYPPSGACAFLVKRSPGTQPERRGRVFGAMLRSGLRAVPVRSSHFGSHRRGARVKLRDEVEHGVELRGVRRHSGPVLHGLFVALGLRTELACEWGALGPSEQVERRDERVDDHRVERLCTRSRRMHHQET